MRTTIDKNLREKGKKSKTNKNEGENNLFSKQRSINTRDQIIGGFRFQKDVEVFRKLSIDWLDQFET